MQIVFGIILILISVFLVVAILMQGGKSNNRLSGAIAGGAETFFGKSKASTMEKKLSRITTIVAIVFAVLVLVLYLVQDSNYTISEQPVAGIEETVDDAAETVSLDGENAEA